MKKILIITFAVALPLAAVVALLLHFRSQTPEALLARLMEGKGDREELVMRLNVARNDIVGPMIAALQDKDAPGSFRADVLDLLFRRYYRAPEPRIEEAILPAIKDPDPAVRRAAAESLATYGSLSQKTALVDSLDDPDPEVRRQAYLVLGSGGSFDDPEGDLWRELSPEQKDRMIETCLRQAETEETPEMRILVRSIVGREIEVRGTRAVRALQGADVAQAEKILLDALELDPENRQAQIRLARFFLKTDNVDKAIELTRQYGALIEVPRLSQPPVIDGDPTDAVWSEAYTTDRFYMTTSRWVARRTEGKSRAYIGHRDGRIYIAVLGYEEDLSRLVLSHSGRDSAVWRDDCVELVFAPEHTEEDYYQFVVNPTGSLYDRTGEGDTENFPCEYSARIFNERGYWACEFSLDPKDLDEDRIESGTIWSLNVFRTRIGGGSELGGIWPLYGRTHRLELYPLARFE